jgi:hypothetical protein
MDLPHEERTVNAETAFRKVTVTERDCQLIANVLSRTEPGSIDQHASLGAVCPYIASQRQQCVAWHEEIARQRVARGEKS